MRALVVGAAGFLGGAAVSAFAKAGHEVRGLVRRPSQVEGVRQRGGEAVLGDLVSGDGLSEALAGCDVAVHLAQPTEGDLAERRRVRVEGGRRLVLAAKSQRVRRLVIGSGYWIYRSSPSTIVEESPIEPRSISLVNFETEAMAREETRDGGPEVVCVRPGMVYGTGSWFGEMVEELRAGRFRYVGDGSQYLSPIRIEDAATAFRILSEVGENGEVYLVVDDQPETMRRFSEYVAAELHAPIPSGRSLEDARREWGDDLAALEAASRRASNRKLRRLGWSPEFATYREGIPGVLADLRPR